MDAYGCVVANPVSEQGKLELTETVQLRTESEGIPEAFHFRVLWDVSIGSTEEKRQMLRTNS